MRRSVGVVGALVCCLGTRVAVYLVGSIAILVAAVVVVFLGHVGNEGCSGGCPNAFSFGGSCGA